MSSLTIIVQKKQNFLISNLQKCNELIIRRVLNYILQCFLLNNMFNFRVVLINCFYLLIMLNFSSKTFRFFQSIEKKDKVCSKSYNLVWFYMRDENLG